MSQIIYGANTSHVVQQKAKEPEPQNPAPAAPEKSDEQIRQEHLEQHLQDLQHTQGVSEITVEGDTVLVKVPVDAIHTLHVDAPEEHQEAEGEPQQENHWEDHHD